MKKCRLIISLLLCSLVTTFCGCSSGPAQDETVSILKTPKASDYTDSYPPSTQESMEKLFATYPDLLDGYGSRSSDLSQLDLTDYVNQILHSNFDEHTIWPKKLPENFDPKKVLEFHKDPGFNLKKLHSEGITGKNINIAFVDKVLLTDHVEYADRLKYYDEVHCLEHRAHFHGPLVTSIASGKTTGIAPESDLYFIARSPYDIKSDNSTCLNVSYTAQAIDKLLERNKTLPAKDKIRVISISIGASPETKGYSEYLAAIERAKKQNIFVINCNSPQIYGKDFYFGGVYIDPMKDKNDINNFKAYPWDKWNDLLGYKDEMDFQLDQLKKDNPSKILLVPMTNKTSAYSSGKNEYVYNNNGGQSSAVPFIAGTYCLACQVNPKITPEEFWKAALETGDPKDIPNCPVKAQGIMINPYKLISTLKTTK